MDDCGATEGVEALIAEIVAADDGTDVPEVHIHRLLLFGCRCLADKSVCNQPCAGSAAFTRDVVQSGHLDSSSQENMKLLNTLRSLIGEKLNL